MVFMGVDQTLWLGIILVQFVIIGLRPMLLYVTLSESSKKLFNSILVYSFSIILLNIIGFTVSGISTSK